MSREIDKQLAALGFAAPDKAAHTPEPWHYERDENKPETWLIAKAGYGYIAEIHREDGLEAEDEANARLIAASPELYTARMGSGLANELRAFLIGDTLEVFNEWYERHRAAIQKVKG